MVFSFRLLDWLHGRMRLLSHFFFMFIYVDCSTVDQLFAAIFPSTAQAGVHEFAGFRVSLRDDNDADPTRIGLVTGG
jgi:hypothetical protein